ncbi:B2L14 protein, partial [Bucco capensis]|nr:B2L14 protein [Bucco capensis]
GTKMSSPNDFSMAEVLMEDDERDSIEYKILMAYAQRRLSASKYRKLLENEANVQKSSSLIRTKAKAVRQGHKDGPSPRAVFQGGVIRRQGKVEPETNNLPGYRPPFLHGRALQQESLMLPQLAGLTEHRCASELLSDIVPQGLVFPSHQTSETADVNRIADKLAKLVTSRSQESPSDVSFKIKTEDQSWEKDKSKTSSDSTDGSKDKEHGKEKIIQTIVSLLRQSGDELEEKIKKDRVFYQHFKDMLSYNFFEMITDLFLEDVSADSTSEPGDQVQCMKVALTMDVVTRLTAVDNHPMNLVLGFGLKYLREHFKPWIQHQGGWEKALTSLDQEEVE